MSKPEKVIEIWDGSKINSTLVSQSRVNTLMRIREIVGAGEAEKLGFLYCNSFEGATYGILRELEKPDVKADVVRVLVEQRLEEGCRDAAIDVLAYAEAAKLPLPEYNDNWIMNQFDTARSEGELYQAWWIATKMMEAGHIIVKQEPNSSQKWVKREKEAFEEYATEFLKQEKRLEDETYREELRMLFNTMIYRDHDGGFRSGKPSKLALEIAEATIECDLVTKGQERMAILHATEAGKPEEEIAQIRLRVPELTDEQRQIMKELDGILKQASDKDENHG